VIRCRLYHRRVSLDELYRDRARAESFGAVAQQYERYRSTYPDALLDDLAALRPAQVLDVGCGTGKAAVGLARRGLSVLGVELDPRMAEVARGHGIPVEVAAFETWDDAGRRFDLITCGSAWHWIDPQLGMAKAAAVLSPGGTIARFWNYHVLDEYVVAMFEALYREHAPDVQPHGRPPDDSGYIDPFAGNEAFSSIEQRTYYWERPLSATNGWDRQRLSAITSASTWLLRTVLQALGETIDAVVRHRAGTWRNLRRAGPKFLVLRYHSRWPTWRHIGCCSRSDMVQACMSRMWATQILFLTRRARRPSRWCGSTLLGWYMTGPKH
jgi:SAM-dependent methyltransferase